MYTFDQYLKLCKKQENLLVAFAGSKKNQNVDLTVALRKKYDEIEQELAIIENHMGEEWTAKAMMLDNKQWKDLNKVS